MEEGTGNAPCCTPHARMALPRSEPCLAASPNAGPIDVNQELRLAALTLDKALSNMESAESAVRGSGTASNVEEYHPSWDRYFSARVIATAAKKSLAAWAVAQREASRTIVSRAEEFGEYRGAKRALEVMGLGFTRRPWTEEKKEMAVSNRKFANQLGVPEEKIPAAVFAAMHNAAANVWELEWDAHERRKKL